MNLEQITPLILTYNEEANIARTLDSVAWATRIVVIDSGSDDATAYLVEVRRNSELVRRAFDNHTNQWNFGIAQVQTPWVLALDADYVCPDGLAAELRELSPTHDAYQAEFKYCVNGKPLRGTLYPARAVLFRADRLRFRQDGHTQLLDVAGPVGKLRSIILHDDRKSLRRWLASQSNYADLEAAKLLAVNDGLLSWKDRLRKRIVWAPLLTFFYCMISKRLVLDGWPGIYYSLQRTYAELLLSLKLLDARLRGREFLRGGAVADLQDQDVAWKLPSQTPPAEKAISTTEHAR
jgi:glycosyltransferase involved in cell wall biosynthesis